MRNGQQSLLQHLETLYDSGAIGELTDRQLLERFVAQDQHTAELAFAVLVKRDGPMVFQACRAILRHEHETEDAFQATFLVLARKARTLWVRKSLSPWLYEVACRIAEGARSDAARRQDHERRAAERTASTIDEENRDDRDAVVCAEVTRLPERYRIVVVLCDLEGLTQAQAAHRLGWPSGTVRSRLARARDRLRVQLTRRGLALDMISLAARATKETPATVIPASSGHVTVQAALQIARGRAASPPMASSAIALTDGVLSTMFWSKVKLVATLMLTGGAVAGAVLLSAHAIGTQQAAKHRDARPRSTDSVKPQDGADAAALSGLESLSPIARSRVDVASKLRDQMFRLWKEGEIETTDFLTWQKRCDDIMAGVITDHQNRARFCEQRVEKMRQLEQMVEDLYQKGKVPETATLMVRLELFDAEDALVNAKAKLAQ